ncbi:MAG TPA: hypothetical protein VFT45_00100 [Longimicrobium sp.]|nr:hypothetical protein [Longimicrobium sp.]
MSSLMHWMEEGQVRRMVKDGTKPESDCERTTITFLAGSGVTDASGSWVLDASHASCEPIGLVQAVSFVATPTFDPRLDSLPIPSYIQTGTTGVGGGPLMLYARSWGCRCEPEPGTPFDYHVAIAHVFVTDK